MAKITLNPIFEQVRGQVGDLVFRRYGQETVMARKPDLSDTEPTPAQQAARERFHEAVLYGKMVMADPATKTLYDAAAKNKGQPVFSLVVADFFHAPEVHEVDLSAYTGAAGDEIVIRAADDFSVTGLQVDLADASGNTIENGAATQNPAGSGRWVYSATAAVPAGTTVRLTVTAHDRPGNVTISQAEHTV